MGTLLFVATPTKMLKESDYFFLLIEYLEDKYIYFLDYNKALVKRYKDSELNLRFLYFE